MQSGDGERRVADLTGGCLPDATLHGSDGVEHQLSQLARETLLLCFYPGDEDGRGGSRTPTSCEVQRAALRDYSLDFAAFGVQVSAVSSEPHALQARRAQAERLPFPLLSDERCSLASVLRLPTFEVRRVGRGIHRCSGRVAAGGVPAGLVKLFVLIMVEDQFRQFDADRCAYRLPVHVRRLKQPPAIRQPAVAELLLVKTFLGFHRSSSG